MSGIMTHESATDDAESASGSTPASELRQMQLELKQLRATDRFVREKEQMLRLVFESASDAIVTIDGEGKVLHANAGLTRVFGHKPDDVIGQSVSMLIPDHLREAHATGLKRFVCTGHRTQPWSGLRLKGLHHDGHEFPVEVSFGSMKLPGGEYRFTGIMRDITQHVEKESSERHQLSDLAHRQRIRSVNEMATGLAHELNQPLLAICLQADAASQLASDESSSELSSALTEIADQAERASRIVRSIRSLVERRKPSREPTSVSALLRTVLPLCEHYAARSRLRLRNQISGELPDVFVDAVQIEQVIANLVQNAVDAMHSPECETDYIDVEARLNSQSESQRMVCISVRDFGSGLPTDSVDQLFDTFFTTKVEGVGLGLAICRTIVEDHGGQITATPADPGTVFSFTVPVAGSGTEELRG